MSLETITTLFLGFMVLVVVVLLVALFIPEPPIPDTRYTVREYSIQSDRYSTFVAVIGRKEGEEGSFSIIRAPSDTQFVPDAVDGNIVLEVLNGKWILHITPDQPNI